MPRFLFIGGGTGGHSVPLLAVRQALLQTDPSAEVRVLTSDRQIDCDFMEREGVTYETVPYPRLGLAFFSTFISNYRTSTALLKSFKPDVVFSKGGALSVPGCIAAWVRQIPIVLHESDAVMGNANRLLSTIATKICLGFPVPSLRPSSRVIITGNPLRTQITHGRREEGLRITGLSGTRPILLVTGGSQGAQAINEAIYAHLDEILAVCDVAHLTGIGKRKEITRTGYWSAEMASDILPHLYACATLAIARGSASMICELAANGVPVILIPIRGLAHDHQYKNALMATENGGCELVLQETLATELIPRIQRLTRDSALREQMSKKIRNLAHPEAAVQIAKILVNCVAQGKNLH